MREVYGFHELSYHSLMINLKEHFPDVNFYGARRIVLDEHLLHVKDNKEEIIFTTTINNERRGRPQGAKNKTTLQKRKCAGCGGFLHINFFKGENQTKRQPLCVLCELKPTPEENSEEGNPKKENKNA